MDLSSLGLDGGQIGDLLARVPDTAWAALVSSVVTLALAAGLLPRRGGAPAEEAQEEGVCAFLLDGARCKPLTAAARALLESIGGRQAPLQALTRHLERDWPGARADLEALVLFGASFRRHCRRADGSSFEAAGAPQGGAALLTVRPASAEARALDDAERALARQREERDFLALALDRAPLMAWRLGPDGQVAWASAAYREHCEGPEAADPAGRHPCAFAHLMEEVPLTARADDEVRRRVRIACTRDGEPHWFELTERPLPGGGTLAFAAGADELVAAEASLRRFVETLTETFAHLPIGLAVFDKNRRLGLFNPALSDLVKIDAVWLAGRPSLRDFLERLRETRQMPEQKDFAAFRRMLTELEEGARDGTYEENWVLPSGKIFRVAGRPHPQGALAFLFEDISPAIHLERRYRGELELSQATLDRMAEAVAVFDTSGMLVFVNSAFEALWGLDPMERLEGPAVAELAALWEARCAPTTLWPELIAFATGADNRTSWTGRAAMADGRALAVLVAPLPNGSTLVTFRAAEAEAEATAAEKEAAAAGDGGLRQAALLATLALAEVEAPVEASLSAIGSAIAASPDARAFSGLMEAAGALKDGLARARSLQAEAEADAVAAGRAAAAGGDAAPDLAGRLGALLALRGLSLARPARPQPRLDAAAEGALAPALPGLAMAAAGLAAPGALLELRCEGEGEDARIALRLPAAAAAAGTAPEPAILALARRRMAEASAVLEIAAGETALTLTARLRRPTPRRIAAAG